MQTLARLEAAVPTCSLHEHEADMDVLSKLCLIQHTSQLGQLCVQRVYTLRAHAAVLMQARKTIREWYDRQNLNDKRSHDPQLRANHASLG